MMSVALALGASMSSRTVGADGNTTPLYGPGLPSNLKVEFTNIPMGRALKGNQPLQAKISVVDSNKNIAPLRTELNLVIFVFPSQLNLDKSKLFALRSSSSEIPSDLSPKLQRVFVSLLPGRSEAEIQLPQSNPTTPEVMKFVALEQTGDPNGLIFRSDEQSYLHTPAHPASRPVHLNQAAVNTDRQKHPATADPVPVSGILPPPNPASNAK